ncbi:MAG: hypothetical protein ACYC5A_09265 [Thermoleophilia bacterium]
MDLAITGKPGSATEDIELPDDSCSACFFGASGLCSLPHHKACPTFRPSDAVRLRIARHPELQQADSRYRFR